MSEVETMKKRQSKMMFFAGSGSCCDGYYRINGKVNGNSFTSEEFSGTMDGQKFWDDLAAFAKKKGMFVELHGTE